jgi:hypothetical protein
LARGGTSASEVVHRKPIARARKCKGRVYGASRPRRLQLLRLPEPGRQFRPEEARARQRILSRMTSPAGKPSTIAQKAKRKISLPWFRQSSVTPPHPALARQHTIDTPSSFHARLLRLQPSLSQVRRATTTPRHSFPPTRSLTHSLSLSGALALLQDQFIERPGIAAAAAAAAAAAVAAVLLAPSLALSPPPAARLSRPSPSTPRACHGRRTWLGVPPHAPLQLPQVSRRADYTLAFSRFSGFELTLGGFSDCSEGHNPHLIPSNSSHYFII